MRKMCIIICTCIVLSIVTPVYINVTRDSLHFREAMNLYYNGDYQEARSLFSSYEGSKGNNLSMLDLCNAQIKYQNGDVRTAHSIVETARYYQKYTNVSPEVRSCISEFRSAIESEYLIAEEAYQAEQERIEEKKQEKERIKQNALRKKYGGYDVPFYKMPEEGVNYTQLGASYANTGIVKNYVYPVGKQDVIGREYCFEQDGKMIFHVTCKNGIVVATWDYRDNPLPLPSYGIERFISIHGKSPHYVISNGKYEQTVGN